MQSLTLIFTSSYAFLEAKYTRPVKHRAQQLEACIVSVPSLLLHRLAPAFPFSCCILLRAARTGDSSCHSHVLEVISRAIQLQGESSLKKVRETPLALHRMC